MGCEIAKLKIAMHSGMFITKPQAFFVADMYDYFACDMIVKQICNVHTYISDLCKLRIFIRICYYPIYLD